MSNHYWAYYILLKKTWSWNIQSLYYKLSALLCSVIFLMEHVMVIFKLKIVNWSTKRPKPVLFTKLFGTQNSMSGSKLLRRNFILAPSLFIDISFSSNVPDFNLKEYMEFENEIIIISTYFQKIFVKYFIIFLFQFLASIYVYRLLFSWDQ